MAMQCLKMIGWKKRIHVTDSKPTPKRLGLRLLLLLLGQAWIKQGSLKLLEAMAVRLAILITKQEGYKQAIIEGYLKYCVGAFDRTKP